MKNIILAIDIFILVFVGVLGFFEYNIIKTNLEVNSFQSIIDRKEMYPLDSLKYKFI